MFESSRLLFPIGLGAVFASFFLVGSSLGTLLFAGGIAVVALATFVEVKEQQSAARLHQQQIEADNERARLEKELESERQQRCYEADTAIRRTEEDRVEAAVDEVAPLFEDLIEAQELEAQALEEEIRTLESLTVDDYLSSGPDGLRHPAREVLEGEAHDAFCVLPNEAIDIVVTGEDWQSRWNDLVEQCGTPHLAADLLNVEAFIEAVKAHFYRVEEWTAAVKNEEEDPIVQLARVPDVIQPGADAVTNIDEHRKWLNETNDSVIALTLIYAGLAYMQAVTRRMQYVKGPGPFGQDGGSDLLQTTVAWWSQIEAWADASDRQARLRILGYEAKIVLPNEPYIP